MRGTPPWLAILGLGVLLACAGIDVGQEYEPGTDFSGYATFDWFPGGRALTGDAEIDGPFLDERIRAAARRELTLRGYREIEDARPDFYVNYHFSVDQKLTRSGLDAYFRVRSGKPPKRDSWFEDAVERASCDDSDCGDTRRTVGVGVGAGPVRVCEEATLVIDVVDAASKSLVWRGSGSASLGSTRKPGEIRDTLDRATAAILARFPPERSP